MTVVAQDVAHEEPARAPWPTGEQRFLLHNISWQQYVAIGEALRDRPGLRITYDRGNLELMTTSPLHEKFKKRLARLIEVLAEEFGLAIETAGNMTFARKDIDRGMELGYRHPMDKEVGEQFRPPSLLRQMVRAGKLGKKTGEGFYRWTPEGPVAPKR